MILEANFWRRSLSSVRLLKPSSPLGRFDKELGIFLEIEEHLCNYLSFIICWVWCIFRYYNLVFVHSFADIYREFLVLKKVIRIILKRSYFQENASVVCPETRIFCKQLFYRCGRQIIVQGCGICLQNTINTRSSCFTQSDSINRCF